MKLTYFQGPTPNFGDELNAFMWDAILPAGFLDQNVDELFLGIGSILWDNYPSSARKVVAGSGFGGYTPPPNVNDGTWQVIFVRGPRTAQRLGIGVEKAICDSAVLLRLLPPAQERLPATRIGFMPHFESLERGFWPEVCAYADIPLIDPRGDPRHILQRIRSLDVLVTEAMHGAIVADAMRTPWICARPVHAMHQAKWLDWTESLGISLRAHPLHASNIREWYQSRLEKPEIWRGQKTSHMSVLQPVNRLMVRKAALRLKTLARMEPQLSADKTISTVTARAAEALDKFVRNAGFSGLKI